VSAPRATAEYPTAPLPRPEAERPGAAGWTRTILIALAVGVAFADSSIVVLALPDLMSRFDTTIGSVSWVVTSYNVTVALLALALVPAMASRREGVRRLDPVRLTQAGLLVFCAASLACALAGDLGVLVAARAVQGAGAALLLAGSVPLLATVAGSPARGAMVWGIAGVMGAALGPALGGALTQVFDWRSIFVAQVPLAAAALLATVRVTVPPPAPVHEGARERAVRLPAGAALALVSAALVGALFLSVVLMIDGWGHAPLLAAAIVSALPAGALVAGPVVRRSAPRVAVCGGIVLVGGGLVAMALLPEPSLALLCIALALCGLGLGLCMPALTDASLRGPSLAASGTWSVGARHAGLVLGLVLLTPLLTADLNDVADRARLAGASALIDAPLSIEDKIAVGRGLEQAIDTAPAGEVPDLRPAIAAGGDPSDPARLALGDRLEGLISDTITRGFRNAFFLCAVLAALALVPVALLRRGALR
jgi:predicted MFS family arabinose efflux permease